MDAEINKVTGTSILGERCESLQSYEATQILAHVVDRVHSDVVSGRIKKTEDLASAVDEHLAHEIGSNRQIARNRRCHLAQSKSNNGGCAIFSEAMYVGCAD